MELICHKVDIQKTVIMAHLSSYEFLTMSFEATTPSSLNESDEPHTLLASLSEGRVLAMQAQSGVGFAATWYLAFNVVLHTDFVA